MPPISPLRVRLTRVSRAMRNSNTSTSSNGDEDPVVEEGNGRGAWKNRFSALSALVQQQDLPFRSKELDEDDQSQEETKPAERRDSLHILFNSSFSNLCEDTDFSDSEDEEDEEKREGEEEEQEEQVEDHAMHTLEKVQETLGEIFQYLQKWGIPKDLLKELYTMEKRLQYTALLKQAEEYTTEYLLCVSSESQDSDNDKKILELFVAAWNYVHEYSQDRYQQIQKVYSELQWKQWQNQVTKFSQEKDEEGHPEEEQPQGLGGLGLGLVRQLTREKDSVAIAAGLKRSLTKEKESASAPQPQEERKSMMAIKEQLAGAVRFRMECQKQCILTKEWTVSVTRRRRQQQLLLEQQQQQQLEQQKQKKAQQVKSPRTPTLTPTKKQTRTLSPKQKQGLLRIMPRMASFNKNTSLNTSSHHTHRRTVNSAVPCRQ